MNPTYRSWLQGLANNPAYGLPSQEANALLQVVGDDFGVNQNFLSDPYAYTKNDSGQVYVKATDGGNIGYGPQGVSALNSIYSDKYNQKYNTGPVLGASTTGASTGARTTGATTVSAPSNDFYGAGGTQRNSEGRTYDEQMAENERLKQEDLAYLDSQMSLADQLAAQLRRQSLLRTAGLDPKQMS